MMSKKENSEGRAEAGARRPKGKTSECDSAITDAVVRNKKGEKVTTVPDDVNAGVAKKIAQSNDENGNPKKR